MNEYMKPDYEVMVFEANEYVAACDANGQRILLDCAENPTGILMQINYALTSQVQVKKEDDTVYWFTRVDGYYVSGNNGQETANLYINVQGGTENPNNMPIFCGPMADGHTDVNGYTYTNGEFDNSGAGAGNTACGCQYGRNDAWFPAAGHHHIQSYTFVDRS